MSLHVVLGAGAVGRSVAASLRTRDADIAVASKSGTAVRGAHAIAADLRDPRAVPSAVEEAGTVYFALGLPYSTRIWQQEWNRILGHAIAACRGTRRHLIYFDNVCAYGHATQAMSESTPIAPASAKGRVRCEALTQLEAAEDEGLTYSVVRSADFFGPVARSSVFNNLVAERIRAGERPRWLFDADQPHSMTYVPDIGDALAAVGCEPQWTQKVWHVPTAPALSGREYCRMAGGEVVVLSGAMVRFGALFRADARESMELAYQFRQPYHFHSDAFAKACGIHPTPIADAIAATMSSGT